MSRIAEEVYEAVKTLSELKAAEVLSFAHALQAKRDEEYERARQQALAMLDNPPLALNGRYWTRDSLYDRL